MFNFLIRWSLNNRMLVLAGAALLLALGATQALRAPVDVFPDFSPPYVIVQTEAPGMAPLQVEQQVTVPLEYALLGMYGVADVRSSSIPGLSVITIIFDSGTDIWTDRQLVAEAITTVGSLPPEVKPPRLAPVTSAIGMMETIGFTRGQAEQPVSAAAASLQNPTPQDFDLRSFADWVVRPRLLAVPGVANVTVYGWPQPQYQVIVNPARLRQYGIGLDEVLAATRAANAQAPGGFFQPPGQSLVIHVAGLAESLDDLKRSVLVERRGVSLTLGDVADIRIGPTPPIGAGTINGQPGLVLQIFKQPGANTIQTAAAVDAVLRELAAHMPPGARFYPRLFSQADFILNSIDELKAAIIEGGLLVVLVLLVFLRDLRAAVISIVAIPLSLLAAVLVITGFGATLNTMTLGGLVLALGEVVDDAIIDVENIKRRLHGATGAEGGAVRLALKGLVFHASAEIRGSVVYATFAVALVLLPIFFLTGVERRIFTPLGEAYIASTLASLLVALTVTPVLSLWLLPRTDLRRGPGRILETLWRRYRAIIEPTLNHPRAIGIVSLAAAILALAALPFMGGAFLPPLRENSTIVHMTSIPGVSIAANERAGLEFERRLMQLPEIASVDQRLGRAELGEDVTPLSYSEFDVKFRPKKKSSDEIAADIARITADFPAFAWESREFITERMDEVLSGETASVAIKIYGSDFDQLQNAAAEVRAAAAGVPGIVNLNWVRQSNVPELDVRFNRTAARNYGITSAQVANAVATAFYGTTVGTIYDRQRRFDLVVRYPADARTLESVRTAPLDAGGMGGAQPLIPLAQVAHVAIEPAYSEIDRENGSRVAVVNCDSARSDLVGFVRDLKARIDRTVKLPAGYTIEYAGQYASRAAAVRRLEWLALAALAGILLLLESAFHSWRSTLLVLINLPLALLGGVLAVLVSRTPVSLATLIGFITLFGITIRNGVMMISHYEHLQRSEGMAFGRELVLRGATERLAPILMTALATGLALTPVVVGGSLPGRELEFPMAVVIVGGLLTSTVLNLIVVPTLYLRYERPAAG
jgi:CzcA family heavy metal efflux pump